MKDKKMITNFIIPFVIYPFDVMVSLGQTDDELKTSLNKYNIKWTDALKLNGTGKYIMLEGSQSVIRLNVFPTTCEDYGTLQHEIFHAVDQTLRCMGMSLTDDSDEAYAYLIGYLTKEIYTKIN